MQILISELETKKLTVTDIQKKLSIQSAELEAVMQGGYCGITYLSKDIVVLRNSFAISYSESFFTKSMIKKNNIEHKIK